MDKRKQKTREAIRNAYAALLLDKQTSKLTITALARKANIDRKTFYLHYDTVEDVMLDYNRQIIERLLVLLEEYGFFGKGFDVSCFFRAFNQIIKENMAFFQHVAMQHELAEMWDSSSRELAERITALYEERVLIKPETLYVYIRFILAGSQEIYKEWLRGDLHFSLDELGRIAADVAFEGFCTVLK